jgi:hypothetical protein
MRYAFEYLKASSFGIAISAFTIGFVVLIDFFRTGNLRLSAMGIVEGVLLLVVIFVVLPFFPRLAGKFWRPKSRKGKK